ncbi:MAG: hypothetical protein M1819_003393 [Sarea resinae]|nr:MAG: hypothetical protein M1819_003393 [Sarea resinae]
MSKFDAERALEIYRTFSRQTNLVVEFLGIARLYETATRLEIPKLKHAPTGLTNSLEEYLHDPDFEVNRRQYLAEQEAKKARGATNGSAKPFGNSRPLQSKAATGQSFPSPKASQAAPSNPPAKGPAPDLIDFFDSIEQNQQPLGYQAPLQQPQFAQGQVPGQQAGQPFQQPVYGTQQTGQVQQQFNPSFAQPDSAPYFQPQQQSQAGFAPPPQQPVVQQDFTGAGFGGYTPQQQQQTFSPQQTPGSGLPQDNASTFQQPPQDQFNNISNGQQAQASNPFRQSMMPHATGATVSSFSSTPSLPSISRQPTNPFAKHTPAQSTPPTQGTPFSASPQIQAQSQQPFQHPPEAQPLQASATGVNPFAKASSPAQTQPFTPSSEAGIAIQQTGSTNPFRQSLFHNQQTGQSWQAGQGTMGGLEQLPTLPVFPRPGQPQSQQPQQQQPGWP